MSEKIAADWIMTFETMRPTIRAPPVLFGRSRRRISASMYLIDLQLQNIAMLLFLHLVAWAVATILSV